ncbi:MAG: DUF2809 domain-containing protein [Tepidisphaeraceae bacterium]
MSSKRFLNGSEKHLSPETHRNLRWYGEMFAEHSALRVLPRRVILLAVVAGIGFYSRRNPVGRYLWDKSMGDLCYAAGAFLLIGVIAPRLRPAMIAAAALVYCIAIECFKLTGVPARWDANALLRVVFGTTFSVHNLICYVVAIGVLFAVERQMQKRPPEG